MAKLMVAFFSLALGLLLLLQVDDAHAQIAAAEPSVRSLVAQQIPFAPLDLPLPLGRTPLSLAPAAGPVDAAPTAGAVLLGATGGWAVGVVGGGLLGHVIDPRRQSEYAPLSNGAMVGIVAGMVVGPALGAHLSNRRRGNPLLGALGSAAGTAAIVLLVQGMEGDGRFAVAAMLPVAQIGGAALVERLTSR